MDIDKLKSAWQKYSSTNENNKLVSEDVEHILNKRTVSITEKIRRNIKIGLAIVFIWIAANIIMNLFTTPLLDKYFEKSFVHTDFFVLTFIFELLIYSAIITALVIFWFRYNKIEKQNQNNTNLELKLTQLVEILTSYRKLFYMLLIIVLIYILAAFTSGFILGYLHETSQHDTPTNMQTAGWVFLVLAFVISAGVILLIYYFLFNLFFKRLYGKYLIRLKETLRELNEPLSELDENNNLE